MKVVAEMAFDASRSNHTQLSLPATVSMSSVLSHQTVSSLIRADCSSRHEIAN